MMKTMIAVFAVLGLTLAAYAPIEAASKKAGRAVQSGCGTLCAEKGTCPADVCSPECLKACQEKGSCTVECQKACQEKGACGMSGTACAAKTESTATAAATGSCCASKGTMKSGKACQK